MMPRYGSCSLWIVNGMDVGLTIENEYREVLGFPWAALVKVVMKEKE